MASLLERDALLAALSAALNRGGSMMFVGGEAGVGKTALVRAFAERVHLPVLAGACDHLTTPAPLAPFADIAQQTGEPLAGLLAAGADARTVVYALLDELRRPALVILEDIHWADEATLDALRILGRRIEGSKGLVLATFRDDEVEGAHPLRVVLGELASAPAVSRLSVPRLSLDAVRVLAEPRGSDSAAIHRLTDGNAFFVTEVLASGSGSLPESVRDAVLARAAPLGADARRLLDLVAVVPGRAELWLLEAVTRGELGPLDECLAAGMLRERTEAVAFRHELARRAIESAIPAARRRQQHAALLEALLDPPSGRPDFSRLAYHADEAGDHAAVLEYARAAGLAAAGVGAHREAADQFVRALRYAESVAPSDRAGLLEVYADEAQLTGKYLEAIAAREESIEIYRELEDSIAEGRSLSRLAVPCITAGRNRDAEIVSRQAIEVLERVGPNRELASAYATQAYVRMISRDNTDGVAWGKRAVDAAMAFEDPDALAFGLNMIGTSLLMAGEIADGVGYLEQSLAVARQEGLEFRINSALGMLGSGLSEMYELELGEHYLHEQIAFATAHDLWPQYARSWLSLVDVYRGRWERGSERAHHILGQANEPITRISALIAIGRTRARRGDPGAAEVLGEALELAGADGHLQRVGHVRAARAEAAWLAGNPDLAADEARRAYPLAVEKRHLWFAGELAYWQWLAGELDTWPDWIAAPYRLQLSGSAAAAAAEWQERGCRYEAARALSETGDAARVLEALSDFEEIGARPAARIARQTLRSLGASVPRGPRPATRANPAELTARELDVLRLMTVGKRNAEIAAELVVSTRTVDHHVSAVLRKLGVRSRGEAAAVAARQGLFE